MHYAMEMHTGGSPRKIVENIWADAGGSSDDLQRLELELNGALLPSIYAIETISTVTTALAGLAAAVAGGTRSATGPVTIQSRHAQAAFLSERYQTLDDRPVHDDERLWGYYQTGDGHWVLLHTGFPHHHAGHMTLLGCPNNAAKEDVATAVARWEAQALEDAMAERILPGVMMRSREEWMATAQGKAVAELPLVQIQRIGDAPPLPTPAGARPLSGVRVLDMTKVIAGPVCGRTLAEHGADVLRVHAPRLPFMRPLVIDTGRGKRSCHLDLLESSDKAEFTKLLQGAHIMTQGYRPGAIARHGFSPEEVAELRPGIVILSLCAWSHTGPWAERRGFDSLVQMASGIADAGARAAGQSEPGPLPCQALDHGTGYLAAFGVLSALARQRREGGTWHVRVSLAQTGEWLHRLGRTENLGVEAPSTDQLDDLLDETDSPFGRTRFIRPVAQLRDAPAYWARGSVPLGHDRAQWLSE